MTELGPKFNPRQESALTWLIVILIVVAFIALVGTWLFLVVGAVPVELVAQHFVAIVGLPAVGAASFVIVFLFRQTSGPVEFEAFTIKFKGAAGPVILWILCFLAMTSAIKMVW